MPSWVNSGLFYRAAMQRFKDAKFLLGAPRTTAAVYLAGYGVECILKSLILAQVPRSQENEILARFRGARAHDYDWLLELYSQRGGPRLPSELDPHFARVNSWSTRIRYSPVTLKLPEAKAFLASASEILMWGERRLT